jgi:hypothetical protein
MTAGATAFVHRKSSWLSSDGLEWHAHDSSADVQRNLAWQQAFYAAYSPAASGDAYKNFIDPERVFRFPEPIPSR